MRRMTFALALLGGCALAAGPAQASMTGTFSRAYGTTAGGAFLFTSSGDFNGITFDPFVTFCLEKNENLDFGTTFTVTGLDTAAWRGGNGGGTPDPLHEWTAWLYQSFRDGSLATHGFDYSLAGRDASADALQRVIWGIEDELGGSWSPAAGLQTSLYNAAVAYGTGFGLGNVRVMNIAWPDGTPAQSQLAIVPVPGAALLAGLGLTAIGAVSTRRRNNNIS